MLPSLLTSSHPQCVPRRLCQHQLPLSVLIPPHRLSQRAQHPIPAPHPSPVPAWAGFGPHHTVGTKGPLRATLLPPAPCSMPGFRVKPLCCCWDSEGTALQEWFQWCPWLCRRAVPLGQEHGAFSTGVPTMVTHMAHSTCIPHWLLQPVPLPRGRMGPGPIPPCSQKGRCWLNPTGAHPCPFEGQ